MFLLIKTCWQLTLLVFASLKRNHKTSYFTLIYKVYYGKIHIFTHQEENKIIFNNIHHRATTTTKSCHSTTVYTPPNSLTWWFFFFFFLVLLGLHPGHMEVPRLGGELELQKLAYTQPQQDLRHICNLHHSSPQHWILNPPSEARSRARILMAASRVRHS